MFAILAFSLAADPQFTVVNKCPPVFVVMNKCPAAPAVAARTFRNGDFHGSHSCPTCGRTQYVIHGGIKGGTHTHRCPYDGTIWRH